MSVSKDDFVTMAGGFGAFETADQRAQRLARIAEILRQLKAGEIKGMANVDRAMAELARLQGRPPAEWDYDPPD